MRFEGTLKSWNAARGFGFIEPAAGGQEIFVHLSAIPTAFRPPRIGQQFSFEVELDREGRKRAANLGVSVVRRPASKARPETPARWSIPAMSAIPMFAILFVSVAARWPVSVWLAPAYLALSIVCAVAYAADKSAARAGRGRTPEKVLLLLGLAGGWPGGLVAQQLLRHKTNKASFRAKFWSTVVLHMIGFVVFHAR